MCVWTVYLISKVFYHWRRPQIKPYNWSHWFNVFYLMVGIFLCHFDICFCQNEADYWHDIKSSPPSVTYMAPSYYLNQHWLSIGQLGTNFSEIWIQIKHFSFLKVHMKTSSMKWWPFCPGGDQLKLTHKPGYWLDPLPKCYTLSVPLLISLYRIRPQVCMFLQNTMG